MPELVPFLNDITPLVHSSDSRGHDTITGINGIAMELMQAVNVNT